MTGEVIKSFLVGLGFDVDEKSLSAFNKSIANASLKITALYASIKIAAAGIGYSISKISEGFEQMGYEYRLIAPAINKTLLLRQELLKAYSAAGINITKVIQQSVLLNFSLAKTKFAFEAIYRSVASRFFPLITKQLDIFRGKLYANMPKIQNALEKFVKFIFKAFEATVQLGTRLFSILGRVYDAFKKLHDATEGWSTIILGIAAAWKILNLGFLASPLGIILTGLLAILALYDDFKTFQEGGESLFNWAPFIPVINAVVEALSSVGKIISAIFNNVLLVIDAFNKLFHLDFSGFANRMQAVFRNQIEIIKSLSAHFYKIWDVIQAIGKFGFDLVGGDNAQNVATNLANNPASQPPAVPIGAGTQSNATTNQKVDQQTNIVVQGSADANSTAKAVANEQGRVNFDITRYLQPRTR